MAFLFIRNLPTLGQRQKKQNLLGVFKFALYLELYVGKIFQGTLVSLPHKYKICCANFYTHATSVSISTLYFKHFRYYVK